MKLNNRGWGLRMMILFIGFLFLGLFIVVVLATQIDLSSDKDDDNRFNPTYETLEKNVAKAGINYQKKYYEDMTHYNNLVVSIDKLQEEFLGDVKDLETNNDCDGYVHYKVTEEVVVIPYIKCDNYTTNGYK